MVFNRFLKRNDDNQRVGIFSGVARSARRMGSTLSAGAHHLRRQTEADKKLVYSLNRSGIPSWKQIRHVFEVLNSNEKRRVSVLGVIIIAGLIFLVSAFYLRNFTPVPAVGGEYTEGLIGAPQYINPLLSQTNDVDSDLVRLVFSGLLKYDENLQLAPDLAQSWNVSSDNKTYTFVLRQGVTWHDGEPLTADDVIFTMQSILDPEFKSPLLTSMRGIQVQKIDDRTVSFTLPQPYPAFLELLTVGILPEHIWGDVAAIHANLNEYNLKPVGSGQWEFKSLIKDKLGNIKSYTLVPYDNYYGTKPYLRKLTFKFYPDFETAIVAAQNHSIEGISFLPKDLKSKLASEKTMVYHSFVLPEYTAVFFNTKKNDELKDKNVRKALALGIDKSKILNDALGLDGQLIDGPLLPVSVTVPDDKKLSYDVATANDLLDKAGWKRITTADYQSLTNDATSTATSSNTTTADGTDAGPRQTMYRKNSANQILSVTLTTVNQTENVTAAKLIQSFWEAIGVKVDLQLVGGAQISRDVIKPRDYQVLLFGIIVGSNPDPSAFWHSSQIEDPGLNLAMFANRDADKLLDDAKTNTDPAKVQDDYQKFQDILVSEVPAVFLYNPTYTYAVDQKIKGITATRVALPADRLNYIEQWYVKTVRRWQGQLR